MRAVRLQEAVRQEAVRLQEEGEGKDEELS